MDIRRSTVVLGLSLLFLPACRAHQAIRQDPNRPLMQPQLVQGGSDLAAFEIAPVPGIPFRATVEAENEIIDENGHSSIERLVTQVARDSRGRTRIDLDLNPVGATRPNPKWVSVSIHDVVVKTDITLMPWDKFAFRLHEKGSSAPAAVAKGASRNTAPAPIEMERLGLPEPPAVESRNEELGPDVVGGMPVRYGRTTTRYPAGYAGLKEGYTEVTEYWYSQELQAFVQVKQTTRGNVARILKLRDIRREDSDISLFRIPKGYKTQETFPGGALQSYGFCPVP
jgi:hypothetical protein